MSSTRRSAARHPDPIRGARLQRDAALERSRTITKGIAFGSVAAVAVAGVYLSQALPGHAASTGTGGSGAVTQSPSGADSSSSGSGSSSVGASSPSATSPSAPAYTPAPAPSQQPVVSSGAS